MNKNWIQLTVGILLCATLVACTSIYVIYENKSTPALVEASEHSVSQNVLNLNEAADYLRISPEDLKTIIKKDEEKKASRGSANVYDLIPYVDLNGNLIFYRSTLDKWIEYHTLNR